VSIGAAFFWQTAQFGGGVFVENGYKKRGEKDLCMHITRDI